MQDNPYHNMSMEEISAKAGKFKRGDREAFRYLFEVFSDRLYRYFMVKTSGLSDVAEDLVQETFFKVWKGRDKYDDSRDFRAWLFGIGYKTFVDHLRQKKDLLSLDGMDVIDQKTSNFDKTHDKLLVEKVLEKLADFPEDARDVIMLTYFSGLTSEEIAAELGKNPGAVRMIRMRSISKLQEIMNPPKISGRTLNDNEMDYRDDQYKF